MDFSQFEEIVTRGAASFGLTVEAAAAARMRLFAERLLAQNEVMNLTAIRDPAACAVRHFVDSLFVLTCAELAGGRGVDVGCGAGFPGLPLRLFDTALDIVPLDSSEKRIRFIREACAALGLAPDAVCARAEDYARTDAREGFDFALSRAVAPLRVLCELCLPLVRVGGLFLPMKSANAQADTELLQAQGALAALGGQVEGAREYTLPDGAAHQVLVIRKTRPTPPEYPRRFAKITARPL